jgi:fyn-related kinase
MIKYYSKDMGGLCCCLVKPCINNEKPVIGASKDKWEIPRKELQKGDMLGSGQFGEVYKGFWNKKTLVAIKTLKANSADMDQFLKEAQVMKSLVHPKLVQLYGVCTVDKPMLIVTELMKNGALLEYLQTEVGRQLSIFLLVDMAAQVADGMAFLERENYIHRDLAARNILVGEDNIVKIADFGLARAIPDDTYEAHIGAKFPVKWTAPEAMNYNKYTIKSDVWSFGILLTELVTYGRIPYPGMGNAEVVKLLENGYRMECPTNCPEELYELMLQCWDSNPMKRPTFATLCDSLEFLFTDQRDYQEPNGL